MINSSAPFPQANDFNKVVSVINIPDEAQLTSYPYMRVYLGDISDRQVDYYISACIYLGLVDKEKHFSADGLYLRTLVGVNQIAELSRRIVSDNVFGSVYFQEKMLGVHLEKDDIVDIMKNYIDLESDAVYTRRASTVISWINWINLHEIAATV